MLWLAVILYGLWITPLRLGADLRVGDTLPRAAWGVIGDEIPLAIRVFFHRLYLCLYKGAISIVFFEFS